MTVSAFKLEDAGFNREQIEALVDFMNTTSATKSDISDIKTELKADIADLKTELKADIADLKTELKTDIARLEGKINAIYWMLGVLIAMNASLLVKLFA